jgi:hypothetical protein
MGLERIPTLETLRLSVHVGHGRAASGIGEGVEAARPQRYKGDDGGHDGAGKHTHAGNATSFGTSVTDVRHLASAKALKQLDLSDTKVTTEGTMGLECIPTLETLLLSVHVGHGRAASGIGEGVEAARPQRYEGDDGGHDGAGMHTHAGRRYDLSSTSVTDVRHLASAKALKQLDLSDTKVTTEGTMGLESIPTLEELDLSSTPITNVRHLASAKKLTWLAWRTRRLRRRTRWG